VAAAGRRAATETDGRHGQTEASPPEAQRLRRAHRAQRCSRSWLRRRRRGTTDAAHRRPAGSPPSPACHADVGPRSSHRRKKKARVQNRTRSMKPSSAARRSRRSPRQTGAPAGATWLWPRPGTRCAAARRARPPRRGRAERGAQNSFQIKIAFGPRGRAACGPRAPARSCSIALALALSLSLRQHPHRAALRCCPGVSLEAPSPFSRSACVDRPGAAPKSPPSPRPRAQIALLCPGRQTPAGRSDRPPRWPSAPAARTPDGETSRAGLLARPSFRHPSASERPPQPVSAPPPAAPARGRPAASAPERARAHLPQQRRDRVLVVPFREVQRGVAALPRHPPNPRERQSAPARSAPPPTPLPRPRALHFTPLATQEGSAPTKLKKD
jgi:hypothetical protein